MTPGPDAVLILTTVADDGRADEIARALVDERIAACVNVHPPMTSIYRWRGAIQADAERQLVIKTTRSRAGAVEARIRELHPYELPELLIIPVEGGGEAYLQWLTATVG
jgi:periplasmic divalent cation tolerance protein